MCGVKREFGEEVVFFWCGGDRVCSISSDESSDASEFGKQFDDEMFDRWKLFFCAKTKRNGLASGSKSELFAVSGVRMLSCIKSEGD